MGVATTHLETQARSFFDEIGYTVSRTGDELRAERKWRSVRVSLMTDPQNLPESGDLRCFVTPADEAERFRRALRRRDPCYDWAVVGVDDDGAVEVVRRTDGRTA